MELNISGAQNARDLGGIKAQDGRAIKMGRIIRCSHIGYLTSEGENFLKAYGLKKVIDLRSLAEIESTPDFKIDGVTYVINPILRSLTQGITRKNGVEISLSEAVLNLVVGMGEKARAWLAELYVPLVNDEFSLKGYRKFFDELMENKSGAVLYHCTAGKDRVGVGTILFLLAMGVPIKDALEDYLLTNKSVEKLTNETIALAREKGYDKCVIESIPYVNGVTKDYFDKAISYIGDTEEKIKAYFKSRLGIDDEYLAELRSNYLE